MKISSSRSLVFILAVLFLGGCASKEPEKAPPAQAPQTAAQKAEPAPAPAAATPAKEAPTAPIPARAASDQKALASAPAQKTPQVAPVAPPSAPAKSPEIPAAARPSEPLAPTKPAEVVPAPAPAPAEKPAPSGAPAKVTPKDVIILKAALGGVRFPHKDHAVTRKVACETCHHSSRSEKPATAPQQACSTCHVSTAIPPMKTKLQAAFHNPMATAGTCIDCHKAQNAQGRAAPVKCLDCHKKENT